MTQTVIDFKAPSVANVKISKKEEEILPDISFKETSKDLWGIFNSRTKKQIVDIEIILHGRKVFLGSSFETRDQARGIKKVLSERYPRRLFLIGKISSLIEKEEILSETKEEI